MLIYVTDITIIQKQQNPTGRTKYNRVTKLLVVDSNGMRDICMQF